MIIHVFHHFWSSLVTPCFQNLPRSKGIGGVLFLPCDLQLSQVAARQGRCPCRSLFQEFTWETGNHPAVPSPSAEEHAPSNDVSECLRLDISKLFLSDIPTILNCSQLHPSIRPNPGVSPNPLEQAAVSVFSRHACGVEDSSSKDLWQGLLIQLFDHEPQQQVVRVGLGQTTGALHTLQPWM